MESAFGMVGDGFAILAADTSAVYSILVHKSNKDKIMVLYSHKLLAARGESGVSSRKYVQKNVALYQFRNGIPLTTAAVANFTRGELATALQRHCHSGMTVEEAIDLVDKCIMEIRSRLVVAPANFVFEMVDKDGAREYTWHESIKDTGLPTGHRPQPKNLLSLFKVSFSILLFL